MRLYFQRHLKPHERFSVTNDYLFRIGRHPEGKGGTAIAVRKGLPHRQVDVPENGQRSAAKYCLQLFTDLEVEQTSLSC
jgi:hypothetical protein